MTSTYQDMFNILKTGLQYEVLKSLTDQYAFYYLEENVAAWYGDNAKLATEKFRKTFLARWKLSNRNSGRFLSKNQNWLEQEVVLGENVTEDVGRPTTLFESFSERTKRRRSEELTEAIPTEEIV